MAKEKNFLIIVFFFFLSLSSSEVQGRTVCTYYDGKRMCGNSLVIETSASELGDCSKGLTNCKKIAMTNSHLTSGEIIEICDKNNKCTKIAPTEILNDVINDIAVFEIPLTAGIVKNGKVSKDKLTGEGFIYPDVTTVSVKTPSWTKEKLGTLKDSGSWQTDHSGFSTFVVARGMSGSPISKPFVDFKGQDISNGIQGIVTGHHNYIPVSLYARESDMRALAGAYLKGDRGLDEKSKKLKARWHYNSDGQTTFRSLDDGLLWETGNLETPAGGGSGTDTGGGSGTDTGDPCLGKKSTSLDIGDFKKMSHFHGLYHGVIIREKQVIGFVEKETGRIIYANWELLVQDDIISGKYKKYVPYYEDQLDPIELLEKNRPELKSGEAIKYCLEDNKNCVELTLNKADKALKISSKAESVVISLKDVKSAQLFKNVPVKYNNGLESTIWLADIFLPDARWDAIRDSKVAFLGGNHGTGVLDILKK